MPKSAAALPSLEQGLIDRKQYLLDQELTKHSDDLLTLDNEKHQFLTQAIWEAVKNQTRAERRTEVFLKHFVNDFKDEDYLTLANAISRTEYTSYVGDELSTEWAVEREDITPTARMDEDAKMLVHRCFGSSRRHTEHEKRKVHTIVAKRLLVLYRVAEAYLQRLTDHANVQRQHGLDMDQQILELTSQVGEFRQYSVEDAISGEQGDGELSKSTRKVVLNDARGPGDKEPIVEHTSEMEKLMAMLNELYQDIEKELSITDLSRRHLDEKYQEEPVDEGISNQLEELQKALLEAQQTAELERLRAEQLAQELRDLQANRRRVRSATTKREMQAQGMNNNTLDRMIETGNLHGELEDEIENIYEEIDLWKWRCEYLEKGKRLNEILALEKLRKPYTRVCCFATDEWSQQSADSPSPSLSGSWIRPYPLMHSSSTSSLPSFGSQKGTKQRKKPRMKQSTSSGNLASPSLKRKERRQKESPERMDEDEESVYSFAYSPRASRKHYRDWP